MSGRREVLTVPSAVFDTAAMVLALHKQEAAIRAERDAAYDHYISTMQMMHAAGQVEDLTMALEGFKVIFGAGWTEPVRAAGLPDLRAIRAARRQECNDGDGRWRGTYPLEDEAVRPADRTWVVYQLLLGEDLLYIGSTGSFTTRLKAHARTKSFDSWRAAKCDSERSCRDLEAALIDRHRPPLNRMIPTPKVVLR